MGEGEGGVNELETYDFGSRLDVFLFSGQLTSYKEKVETLREAPLGIETTQRCESLIRLTVFNYNSSFSFFFLSSKILFCVVI